MRSITSKMGTVLFALTLVQFTSSNSHSQQVFEACKGDIQNLCSNVEPGDGRLLACFYAHEDKISDQCDAAIGDAADQLDWFMDNLRISIATCAADIQKHCSKVAAGEGRIYQCLKKQKSDLNQECASIVDTLYSRIAE